jgi:hypothetical protein
MQTALISAFAQLAGVDPSRVRIVSISGGSARVVLAVAPAPTTTSLPTTAHMTTGAFVTLATGKTAVADSSSSSPGISAAGIAGIVLAVLFVVAVFAGGLYDKAKLGGVNGGSKVQKMGHSSTSDYTTTDEAISESGGSDTSESES